MSDFKVHSARLGISTLPWRFVEQFKERLEKNHSQDLETLNRRGGLCWEELFAGVTDQRLDFRPRTRDDLSAYERSCASAVLTNLAQWIGSDPVPTTTTNSAHLHH